MTDTATEWSERLVQAIAHAHSAHARHSLTPDKALRFHDRRTPYIVHPLWCAAGLLQEPSLPVALRERGSLALLWHDTLEDTTLPLPVDAPPEVVALVEGMTFASFAEEARELWERPSEVKLLKLYDKTSNLLDGKWMKTAKWNAYVAHTLRLAGEVERAYGALNIVRIARAIAVAR